MTEELVGILGDPVAFEPLKDKPGKRSTLRATGSSDSAIVKIYASDRAPIVAERVGALGAGPHEPVVPRVLLCDPARHLVVLSYVPGRPLSEAVLARDGDACVRAGSALGSWHGFWRGRAPRCLMPHTSRRELEILDTRAGALPVAEAEHVRRIARSIRPSWTCSTVVHRDLYEEQVLVGERIGLIDLDDAAIGPPELDVGNLLAHLELLGLRYGLGMAEAAGALLEGYAASGADLDPGLLDSCRRLSLLRLVCIHGEPRLLTSAESPAPGTPT
jgi:Ser/Thr protein kinase RdoA (MazF antagonist)